MKQILALFLKGIWIGGTLSVPGVSGGSMAMILGVYENMVRAVNMLISRGGKKMEAIKYLFVIGLGGILGLISVSGSVLHLLERYPMHMIFFFSGAIAGGIPLIWREGRTDGFKWGHLCYVAAGLIGVIFLRILPNEMFLIGARRDFFGIIILFVGGLVAAVALVLPGISVSHILYVLGLYTGIITAVSKMDLYVLCPFAIGISLGTVLSARGVDLLMLRYRSQAYMVILGFVLGSVLELIASGMSRSFSFLCVPLFIIGYCAVYLLSKKKAEG